jgi:uncharacterized protein (DUF2147 family)
MRLSHSILALSALAIVPCHTACSALVAVAENTRNVHGYWLTEDGALIIEIIACEDGTTVLCGFIRALPGAAADPELAQYASELCNIPLLSNLTYEMKKDRWSGGDIFDPETEQMYAVYIQRKSDYLKVRAFEGSEWMGETLKWTVAESPFEGCQMADASQ